MTTLCVPGAASHVQFSPVQTVSLDEEMVTCITNKLSEGSVAIHRIQEQWCTISVHSIPYRDVFVIDKRVVVWRWNVRTSTAPNDCIAVFPESTETDLILPSTFAPTHHSYDIPPSPSPTKSPIESINQSINHPLRHPNHHRKHRRIRSARNTRTTRHLGSKTKTKMIVIVIVIVKGLGWIGLD